MCSRGILETRQAALFSYIRYKIVDATCGSVLLSICIFNTDPATVCTIAADHLCGTLIRVTCSMTCLIPVLLHCRGIPFRPNASMYLKIGYEYRLRTAIQVLCKESLSTMSWS
jgi:hypothetical protein